ncbi:MAG TPA: AraC family transcriptional regulator [Kribbella sp.]|uniref:AraC family transcriptional regulator n=1 Tax=Kribbella sp. TaxID=1871183 RepID=UPI002D7719E2|nr:AraC family transcriptional regulator [Kribbella sp.]HET6299359.1 AraC family transcriptional regulator [Kribbella sp.]
MDVLSDVLTVMRTGKPQGARTQAHAPWGLRFPPGETAGCHVVLQGSCWLVPPHGEPVALNVGDVVFDPRGSEYVLTDSPGRPTTDFSPTAEVDAPQFGYVHLDGPGAETVLLCAAYQLDRARSHPLLDDLPDLIHLPSRLGRHASLRSAIELLGHELDNPRAGTEAILPAIVDMLLLFILRAWHDEQADGTTPGWAAALTDPAMSTALGGIHHHPERQWTVEDLAAQAGLSRAAFAKRFTAIVGQPPLTYLTWWRMTTAARLLRDSNVPLRTVAARSGYTSEFAFAKAFKREYGTPPGIYRRHEHDCKSASTSD